MIESQSQAVLNIQRRRAALDRGSGGSHFLGPDHAEKAGRRRNFWQSEFLSWERHSDDDSCGSDAISMKLVHELGASAWDLRLDLTHTDVMCGDWISQKDLEGLETGI